MKASQAVDGYVSLQSQMAIETESNVITAMLFNRSLARLGANTLTADAFLSRRNQMVFRAAVAALDDPALPDNITLDPVMLAQKLSSMGYAEQASRVDELSAYYNFQLPQYQNAERFSLWVERILRAAARRDIVKVCRASNEEAYDPENEVEAVITKLTTDLRKIQLTGARPVSLTAAELVDSMLSGQGDGFTPFPIEMDIFNQCLREGSFDQTDFIIVAARPYCGKTRFSTQLTLAMANSGKKVLYFPLEMTPEMMIAQMRDMIANIPFSALQAGRLSEGEMRARNRAMAEISDLPIRFYPGGRMLFGSIIKEIQILRDRGEVDAVIIDHLGLIQANDSRMGRTYDEISHFSRELKVLTTELRIPIICPHQINREGDDDGANGKRITMRHLRYSGNVEQDADVVIIMQPKENETPSSFQVEFVIEKNRKFVPSTCYMRFDRDRGIFEGISGTVTVGSIPPKKKQRVVGSATAPWANPADILNEPVSDADNGFGE